jgi:hypothetical protein
VHDSDAHDGMTAGEGSPAQCALSSTDGSPNSRPTPAIAPAEQAELIEPAPEACSAVPPVVQFRARKRGGAGKARPRGRRIGADDNTDEEASNAASSGGGDNGCDHDEALKPEDIALLRAAQRLREQARRTHAAPPIASRAAVAAAAADAALLAQQAKQEAGGLRTNFAVESSGYDARRNMEQFVEQRMVAKFGRRDTDAVPTTSGEHSGTAAATVADAEADLYSVPDHIRVPEREQYDPTEGLPAAGVEEVDIGAAAKRRNAEETAVARDALMAKREAGRRDESDLGEVMGNVSANFEQHRRDWINTHLGSGPSLKLDKPPSRREGNKTRSDVGGSGNVGINGGGKRSVGMATDQAVVDRFRKRWRK